MFGLRSIGKSLANALSHVASKGEVLKIDSAITDIVNDELDKQGELRNTIQTGHPHGNRAIRRALRRGTNGVRKRSSRNAAYHGKRGNKFTGEGCLMYPGKDTHDLSNDKGFQLVENSKTFSIVAQTKRPDLTKKELAAV